MSTEFSESTSGIDVAYVAQLARLRLSDEELPVFQAQLDSILDYVAELNEVDVEGIEPMVHAGERSNVVRPDTVKPSLDHDDVMGNAPKVSHGQFAVPQIVE